MESKFYFYYQFVLLAKRRLRSQEDYHKFQEFQAKRIMQDLRLNFDFNRISWVIDWGCGNGGYSEVLNQHFNKVIGLDLSVNNLGRKSNVVYREVDLLDYQNLDAVDLIFCSSVIEHVNKPKLLLDNINRNLKSNGYLYLSFPPFYSIGGGHHVKPFHFLPERIAISIAKSFRRVGDEVTSYENLFGTWGLYKTTIGNTWRLLEETGFKILNCKPRYSDRNVKPDSLLVDFKTWHVEFYCQKISE